MLRAACALALAVTLTIASATSASAVILEGENGSAAQYQAWADQAAVPTYPGVVRLTIGGGAGECGNPLDIGCTDVASDGVPQIWVDQGDRQTLYHELGHVFDFMVGSDGYRAWFAGIWQVTVPPSAWWQPSPALSDGPLGEWFAEGYRECADGVQGFMPLGQETAALSYSTIYGYPGGTLTGPVSRRRWALRKQRMVCDLIRVMANGSSR